MQQVWKKYCDEVRLFRIFGSINAVCLTGSAHCALTPLWYEKTGKSELYSFQLSKRTGILRVKQIDDRIEI